MTQQEQPARLSAELLKILNSHGHGFHYAVMGRSERLSNQKKSAWVLTGAEFPVDVGGQATHIDFVRQSRSSGHTFLVAECKRADPATARWCFAPVPYTWRNDNPGEVIFDQFDYSSHDERRRPEPSPKIAFLGQADKTYHIAHELRTNRKGDGVGRNRSEIDQAVAQVLRGSSGFINHVPTEDRWPSRTRYSLLFVPAIFTTAELWVTDADLGAADLATGDLPPAHSG